MSLILAEIYTRQNNLPLAQNYLLYTAKRNKDITSIADLPTTQADLLQLYRKNVSVSFQVKVIVSMMHVEWEIKLLLLDMNHLIFSNLYFLFLRQK